MDKEVISSCNHNFTYVRTEIKRKLINNTTDDFEEEVDVVICTRCGQVRRYDK